MLNFYPGPSKLDPFVPEATERVLDSGILSKNHRSHAFMELYAKCTDTIKRKLHIPENYMVLFTSSATECWEILNQSLLYGKVRFLYSGAFGKKWFKYAITNKNSSISEIRGSRILLESPKDALNFEGEADCLCYVHTETSNGYFLELERRAKCICMDATSSFGGVFPEWKNGDVWLCSSQKCLGLPSGLGIMVVSPFVLEKAQELNERNHYNSLLNLIENAKRYQTHITPNIFGIAILHEVLNQRPDLKVIDKEIRERMQDLLQFFKEIKSLKVLSQISPSPTVLALQGEPRLISHVHEKAKEKGIILGQGYGEWRENTFRIANFPAHNKQEFNALKAFINQCI